MTFWDTPQNAIQTALELIRREQTRQANDMAQRQIFAQNTGLQPLSPDMQSEAGALESKYHIPGSTGLLYPMSPEDQARYNQLTTGRGFSPTDIGTPADQGTLGPRGFISQLTSPVIPAGVNPLSQVPVIGESLGRLTSPLTSPLGGFLGGAFPEATAGGIIGGTLAGTAGGALESAGVPTIGTPLGGIGPRSIGELAGSIAGPFAGPPALEAVARQVPRSFDMEAARVAAGTGAFPIRQAEEITAGRPARFGRPEEKAYFPDVQQPTPEGILLTSEGFPNGQQIREADIRNMEARTQLAQERGSTTASGAPSAAYKRVLGEQATIEAQADINDVLTSGQPVVEQHQAILDELRNLEEEQVARAEATAARGAPTGRWDTAQFGDPERKLQIQERVSKGAFVAGMRHEARPGYPDHSNLEIEAMTKVYRNFVDNARFDPDPRTFQQRFTPEGQVVAEQTFGGPREAQAPMFEGQGPGGTLPPETAGPMFAKATQVPATRAVPPELAGGAAPPAGGGPPPPTTAGAEFTPNPQDAFEAGKAGLIDSILPTVRRNIRETAAIRSQQSGQRLGASEEIFNNALAQGKSYREAFALKRAAQSGEYAPVAGLPLAQQLPEYQQKAILDRIDTFDFGRGATAPDWQRDNARGALLSLSLGESIQENEVHTLEKVLGPEFGTAFRTAATKNPQGYNLPYELAMAPKAILSAFDMSYPLRQGIMLAPGHPIEFAKAFAPMFRAFGSEKGATAVYQSLAEDATPITMANGEQLTMGRAMQDTGLLPSSEQQIRGQLAEKIRIPFTNIYPIRASNRAFAAFGNKFRGDVFRTIVNNWQKPPSTLTNFIPGFTSRGVPITEERLQNLSNMLNRFSGRGTLGPLSNAGIIKGLNATWWAPSTRLAPPEAVAQLFNYKDPVVAKEAWRNMVAFLGTGSTLLGAAKLGGFDVSIDPRNTDFGKVVIGKTHVNIWGPAQPLARTLARIATAQRVDIRTGGVVPTSRLDEAWRYFRTGLAPEWAAVYDVLSGKNVLGQPIKPDLATLKRELPNRLLPLAMQDFYDAIREEGPLAGAAVAPATFFGESLSTYGQTFNPKYPPAFDQLPYERQVALDNFLARVDAQRAQNRDKDIPNPPFEQSIVNLATQEGHPGDFTGMAIQMHKSLEASTTTTNAGPPVTRPRTGIGGAPIGTSSGTIGATGGGYSLTGTIGGQRTPARRGGTSTLTGTIGRR